MKSVRNGITKEVKYYNGLEWTKPLTAEMTKFEEETGKHAVWNNKVTGRFEFWMYWSVDKSKTEKKTEVKKKVEEKKSDTVVNGHVVKTVDLRPIGKKDEKMCIRCGAKGLRTLQKTRCFDTELPSEKYPYKNPPKKPVGISATMLYCNKCKRHFKTTSGFEKHMLGHKPITDSGEPAKFEIQTMYGQKIGEFETKPKENEVDNINLQIKKIEGQIRNLVKNRPPSKNEKQFNKMVDQYEDKMLELNNLKEELKNIQTKSKQKISSTNILKDVYDLIWSSHFIDTKDIAEVLKIPTNKAYKLAKTLENKGLVYGQDQYKNKAGDAVAGHGGRGNFRNLSILWEPAGGQDESPDFYDKEYYNVFTQ